LKFSIAYHPKIDGKVERVNQALEDMIPFYVKSPPRSWEDYITLLEFSYNNGYHHSFNMIHFESLYGKKYNSLVSWDSLEVRITQGSVILEEMEEVLKQVKKNMKDVHNMHKIYVDKKK
jgi:hypothetical protein